VRVLIIDDSAFMRKALASLIGSDSTFEIVGSARDGQEGLEKILKLKPDLVTLDIEMPVMDGLTALQKISQMPEPKPLVLMCSTLTIEGSHAALKAMRLGAADIIGKDPQAIGAGSDGARKELLAKLKAMGETRQRRVLGRAAIAAGKPSPTALAKSVVTKPLTLDPKAIELIVIGSSTGGPPVLEQVLTSIPADCAAPIIVAQHMPRLFTRSISERLNEHCKVPVVHAEAGCDLVPGMVYITPGGLHSRVHRGGKARFKLEISESPTEALYKPSVHELFMSAAKSALGKGLGIMLTGMGDDGVNGARAMFAAGATIIAQSAETCVVYGMPKAVIDASAATAVLSPDDIASSLRTLSPSSGVRSALAS
jgi:two-component system, chemotaxis family, protein-glutamate methylesterase/glutaminase